MKNFLFAMAMTWVATNANALVRPFGTEIPVLRAELTEYNVDKGMDWVNPTSGHSLTQYKRGEQVSSFAFSEFENVVCKGAPCEPVFSTVYFRVQSADKDNCGSTIYRGYAARALNPMLARPPQEIEVVNHATRLCEDYRPYRWEVKVTTLVPTPPPTEAFTHVERTFVGNPEPVYTIQ